MSILDNPITVDQLPSGTVRTIKLCDMHAPVEDPTTYVRRVKSNDPEKKFFFVKAAPPSPTPEKENEMDKRIKPTGITAQIREVFKSLKPGESFTCEQVQAACPSDWTLNQITQNVHAIRKNGEIVRDEAAGKPAAFRLADASDKPVAAAKGDNAASKVLPPPPDQNRRLRSYGKTYFRYRKAYQRRSVPEVTSMPIRNTSLRLGATARLCCSWATTPSRTWSSHLSRPAPFSTFF